MTRLLGYVFGPVDTGSYNNAGEGLQVLMMGRDGRYLCYRLLNGYSLSENNYNITFTNKFHEKNNRLKYFNKMCLQVTPLGLIRNIE